MATTPGTFNVVVTTVDNQSVTTPGAYTYSPPPSLAGISPEGGPIGGGNTLTLTGVDFVTGATVAVGGINCPVTASTPPTIIECTVPATILPPLSLVDIQVTNPDTQTDTLPQEYRYANAPTIATIVPTGGNTAGGTSVVITGSNFFLDPSISIGGSNCINPTLMSSTQLTCITTAHVAGVEDVVVTNSDTQSVTASGVYTYQDPPLITNIAPLIGPLAGGTTLTITGSGFVATTSITLDGNACSSPTISATQITCTIPPSPAGSVDVVVTNPFNQSDTEQDGFTYQGPPTLTGISVAGAVIAGGSISGGTTVNLSGTNFADGATIVFDAGGSPTPCINVNFLSSTSITCETGAHAAGLVDITLTNIDGQAAPPLTNAFTYAPVPVVTGVTPDNGSPSGGTAITVTGSGFTPGPPASIVAIDGSTCTITSITSTSISCTTPSHASSATAVSLTVTNPDGQTLTAPYANAFTYNPAPTLTSVSPIAGALAGGTTITIDGTGFLTGATVSLGGSPCTAVAVNSATQITCTTPALPAGLAAIVVSNPDGQMTTDNVTYRYKSAPTISGITTTLSDPIGPIAGGTIITVNGSNFSTGTPGSSITLGGNPCPIAVTPTSTASRLTCTAPTGTSGSVDIVVINDDNQQDTLANAFTYLDVPTITSTIPTTPVTPLAGGLRMTLLGNGNFYNGATVAIDSTPPTPCGNVVVNIGGTQLTCTTGTHLTPGTYDLTVTNPDTQSFTLTGAIEYESRAQLQFVVGSSFPTPPDPADWGILSTNASRTLTLENIGDVITSAITVRIMQGNPQRWQIGTDNCSGPGNELSPNTTCTVDINFLGALVPTGTYSDTVEARAATGGDALQGITAEKP